MYSPLLPSTCSGGAWLPRVIASVDDAGQGRPLVFADWLRILRGAACAYNAWEIVACDAGKCASVWSLLDLTYHPVQAHFMVMVCSVAISLWFYRMRYQCTLMTCAM